MTTALLKTFLSECMLRRTPFVKFAAYPGHYNPCLEPIVATASTTTTTTTKLTSIPTTTTIIVAAAYAAVITTSSSLWDNIGSIWWAVPKKRVTRSKKRMKRTAQCRIPLRKDIVIDPRTGETTLRHRLPANWKEYLPEV